MKSLAVSTLLSLPFLALASDHFVRQMRCDSYVVSNMTGAFRTRQFIDFSTAKAGDNTQVALRAAGLTASDWPVKIHDDFLQHMFRPINVELTNAALNLKVQAYSGSGDVQAAEIATDAVFLYGSVRTVMKSSTTPGVCEGNFLYANKYNEVDYETLTSTIDVSSRCVPQGIWATHQALSDAVNKTSVIIPFPFDPRTDFHEYRIDWSADASRFYLDGAFQTSISENVPEIAGPWMWNVWSNGDPCWSAGPPTADSITQIRSIEIFRDFISQPTGNVCNV
ncbi:concanavalin A-like lectin/glucanase [Coprinopsis marcescibilis]|uniref:Concanavalin A-like lectin/glucanase n=1 Tax=Coprinopsis marcescibilis TaxID=230819 RepID=A0A5C3LAD8_COPMA|nr:concanavalin A-like lectin/glucanase [Coprinopsis marcescibilis]